MANKGQILSIPKTGEFFEFVTLSAETHGQFSTVKTLIKPGGFKPVLHKHLDQDEVFEVLSGRLTYVLDGRTGRIGAGEKVTLPKGVPHTHFNAELEDLVMLQTASPALDFEPFLESLTKIINDGKVPNGQPPFLQLMVWMKELRGTTCIASLPVGFQKWLASLLTPVGKWAGYKAYYS